MFNGYTPITLLLWIAALAMVLGLVAIVIFTACLTTYMNFKDQRAKEWVKAIGKALEETLNKTKADMESVKKNEFMSMFDQFLKMKNENVKEEKHE